MPREVVFRTPNRQDLRTGHATFDRELDCVTTGNRIGRVMHGLYIRSASTCENEGSLFPRGYLRERDLSFFRRDLPERILAQVLAHTEEEGAWLYCLRHCVGSSLASREIVHGYVLTRGRDHRLLGAWVTGPTAKSKLVVRACLPYLAEIDELPAVPGWRSRSSALAR
jgi:hypothetical protein